MTATDKIGTYFLKELLNKHFILHTKQPILLFSDGETLKDEKKWLYYVALLSDEMQVEIKKYKKWQDQKNYLVGRLLCYTNHYLILGKELNFTDWIKEDYGKPYLMNSDFRFSISHSKNQVVCLACKKGTFGIDIEEIKPLDFNEFTHHFTDSELNEVEVLGATHFYKLWTIKEALIKCLGKGLSKIPMKNIKIKENLTQANFEEYSFLIHQSEYKNFIYSVASFEEIKNISRIEVVF